MCHMKENSQKLLDIERSLIEAAILEEIKQQGLTLDYLDQGITIFLTSYYIYEKQYRNTARCLI